MHSVAGEDYTTTSVTVRFQAAETSQVVTVPILIDTTFEGIEQFTAQLSLPAGQSGVVLGASMASVEITDDDCKHSYRSCYKYSTIIIECIHISLFF